MTERGSANECEMPYKGSPLETITNPRAELAALRAERDAAREALRRGLDIVSMGHNVNLADDPMHAPGECEACDFKRNAEATLGLSRHVPVEDDNFFDDLKAANRTSRKLRADLDMVSEALRKLVDACVAVDAHPAYHSVFILAAVHGCPYDGPRFCSELSEAKLVLAALPAHAATEEPK